MESKVQYFKGEQVKYNDTVYTVSRDFGNRILLIDENGQAIFVSKKNNIFEMYTESIQGHNARIAHNQEIIDENKELHSLASNAIRLNRRGKQSVLREAGVQSADQIQDKTLFEKFKDFCVKLWDAIKMRNRATSAICSAAISTSSECSAKINDIYGLAIAQKTLGGEIIAIA